MVRFFGGHTQTTNTFTAEGSVGNLITLKSSSTTKANLTKSGGGTIEVKYCDISYLNATPEDT